MKRNLPWWRRISKRVVLLSIGSNGVGSFNSNATSVLVSDTWLLASMLCASLDLAGRAKSSQRRGCLAVAVAGDVGTSILTGAV